MKLKRNLLILSAILIGVLIVVAGCLPAPTTPIVEEGDAPTNGSISIASAAATTNDTTPSLTLSSTGATYMAFSGNGTTWSSWVTYATAYSTFNITTGAGCTSGDGTKTVYVKFKNDDGESTKVYDSIILDTVKPTLSTAVYTDVGSGGTVNLSDTIVFTFDDEMDITTVTSSTVAANLLLSNSKSYGTSPTVSWDSTLKICTVTLGTSPTLVVGTTTVNPSALVKDTAGNTDNSSAVTISTTTTVLSSVSISPATATATVGTATSQSFTASALSTAATTMTTSCTFTWSISPTSGRGSLSATSGTTVTYTFPTDGTEGTATITVSAVKTGTTTPTKTDTSTVTVSAAVASTTADATKLFVSAQNDKAKYTSLASGYSVKVYSYGSDNADSAVAAGVKGTIDLEDIWTTCSAFGHTDFIYFTLTNPEALTSAVTSDGQISEPPTVPALGKIQATSTTKVTSSPAGNLTTGDKIKCYVGTTAYSVATNVGTDMTITTAFIAGNDPLYTKTNTAGHESVVSSADGEILACTGAADTDIATANTLAATDKITLTFTGGASVIVQYPIYVSDISWVATDGSSKFGNSTDEIRGAADSAASVELVATSNCVDIDSDETVAFNIDATIPIVDALGGNQVLPLAADETFDSSSF